MEVHHHSHTERKKWHHYFWEFFMLFLAVTLGFLVENQREHFVEHKRERQYIQSMIQDLKTDTASFRNVIETNTHSYKKIDTLISLLKGAKRNESARRIYYLARFIPLDDENLVCQNKTFEQLKSSGSLRLIRNTDILNKISDYYQISRFIETGPTPMQYQNRRDLLLTVDKLFDIGTFQEMMRLFGQGLKDIPESHFVLLSSDPQIINAVCARYHFMYSTKKVVNVQAERFIKQATSLLNYLQKEYHLK